ncbi:MAG: Gfo/Idh/MocA family oxidoreductase [Candidatus Poribacteria bacterium]|nr:Gfo/Idh/MocA family oxidoreductase [Candidatus Poribacteria bacterium]
MSKLRIGIVGSGGAAKSGVEQFSIIDTANIAAVASRNHRTGEELALRHESEFMPDWRNLVRHTDVDGVAIFTHNDSHGEIAIAALDADKHVFVEYPLARSLDQGEAVIRLAKSKNRILRVSHAEPVSNMHKAIKRKVQALGGLLWAGFWRLTPGRGARPEILLNLPVSGPPAHFFIYHIYPAVDIFGRAQWVEGSAVYEGLDDVGRYDRFINTVTVGFSKGGVGQWTWAGGVETNGPEQHSRYVLNGGTVLDDGDGWHCATSAGIEEIRPLEASSVSIHERWTCEILNGDSETAFADAAVALEAIRISLAAEQSMREHKRIALT